MNFLNLLDTEHKLKNFVIGVKILLYIVVSIISTIHVIDFFLLTNPYWLAISLALAFEIGAAASLAAILVLPKSKQTMVWIIFTILTLTQSMGNMYFAYDHAENYQTWMELFGLTEFTDIEQKRILAIASGAILPIVALGFIKSLVDYLKPESPEDRTLYQEMREDVAEELSGDEKEDKEDKEKEDKEDKEKWIKEQTEIEPLPSNLESSSELKKE